jgi:predicted N-acyltransferase
MAIIDHSVEEAKRLGFSSLHWLFTTDDETDLLCRKGFLRRVGCQFHWHNNNYRDFSDFLETLASKKRKNINRERRLVGDTTAARLAEQRLTRMTDEGH